MKAFFAAVALFVSICSGAVAQGCGPTNPSCIVPTAPSGTSNNQAASTAFVQGAVSTALPPGSASQIPVYTGVSNATSPKSGPVWLDSAFCNTVGYVIARTTGGWVCSNSIPAPVTWFGAVHDGVTDDSAAFKAARVALDAQGGGRLYAPAGTYCLKTADANSAVISIASTPITVVGDGINVTTLATCGADVSIVYANVVGSGIMNLSYAAKGAAQNPSDTTFGATKPAFKFDAACGICRIDYVRGFGGLYALDNLGFDSWVTNFSFGYAYGAAIMHEAGNGHRVEHGALDQNWPVVLPNQNSLTINAWQATHAYSGNGAANTNVVSTQGYNIQLVSASCTSGGSAPTLKNYGTAITDGTCSWQLVGATTYYGDHCDGNCAELILHGEVDLNCGGCTANFAMVTLNAGTAPNLVDIDGSSLGQAIGEQIFLHDGSGFTLTNSHIATASQSNASGLNIGNNAFAGSASISNNRFSGPGNCIAIGLAPSGTSGYSIFGNRFDGCTTAIDYFNIAAALHITAGHNTMAGVTTAFTAPSGSSFYEFTNNDIAGAAVSFGAGDANKSVYGNDGAAIPNSALANPSVTVGGATCTLGSTCLSTQASQMAFAPGFMVVGHVSGVNFNSANTDNAIAVSLPTGYTRYMGTQFKITNASAAITTATFGVFPATGGSGTAIVNAGTAITVSSSADATNNNAQNLNGNNVGSESFTLAGTPTLYFRVGTAQGSPATGDVTVYASPVP